MAEKFNVDSLESSAVFNSQTITPVAGTPIQFVSAVVNWKYGVHLMNGALYRIPDVTRLARPTNLKLSYRRSCVANILKSIA
jgi:hypothetical protein